MGVNSHIWDNLKPYLCVRKFLTKYRRRRQALYETWKNILPVATVVGILYIVSPSSRDYSVHKIQSLFLGRNISRILSVSSILPSAPRSVTVLLDTSSSGSTKCGPERAALWLVVPDAGASCSQTSSVRSL